VGVVFLIALLIWSSSEPSSLVADPTQTNVTFSSRAVASGLPNSVVFDYQLAGIQADSFFIQQSWDERLRDQIDPSQQEFTSIYYYPGHFWAKLVANDEVLLEHPLVIPSEGWDAIVDRGDTVPIYLESESADPDEIRLSDAWITENLPDLRKGAYILNWYHVGQFDPIPSRSVVLQLETRLEVDPAFAPCQDAMITLIGQHGRVAVPLAIPGCSSQLSLVASDRRINGTQRDLSGLGVDLSGWTPISIGIQDRMVFVRIDGQDAFSTPFSREIGNIVGLRFQFRGEGQLRDVVLSGEDQVDVLAIADPS